MDPPVSMFNGALDGGKKGGGKEREGRGESCPLIGSHREEGREKTKKRGEGSFPFRLISLFLGGRRKKRGGGEKKRAPLGRASLL